MYDVNRIIQWRQSTYWRIKK